MLNLMLLLDLIDISILERGEFSKTIEQALRQTRSLLFLFFRRRGTVHATHNSTTEGRTSQGQRSLHLQSQEESAEAEAENYPNPAAYAAGGSPGGGTEEPRNRILRPTR